MRAIARAMTLATCAVVLLVLPAAAVANHDTRPSFELEALGHSANPAGPDDFLKNSDLAFWGNLAVNGNYEGFRIIDITDRRAPQEVVDVKTCAGSQGDIVVWENILVRSWNSPAEEGMTCMGQEVPQGWEGVHVFDISDPRNPQLLTAVELPCGSHTQTAIPDRANDRLVIYNQTSGGPCYFFDILEVPFDAPQDAKLLRQEPLEGEHACHDSGVILGDVNMMACASGHMTNVFDIGANDRPGGSITNPEFLYTVEEEGVGPLPGADPHSGSWHSAAFTWDGKVLVLGWEPGGGVEAECEATDDPVTHTMFFYDTSDGHKIGQWTLPRKQLATENCTIHNYNILPIKGKYIVTSGNYQAGTWITDFTDPANPFVRAWSDPPSIGLDPGGGAWSSYWYNDLVYESSIVEGLNVFRYTEPGILRQTMELDHLNPQTEEFSLPGSDGSTGGPSSGTETTDTTDTTDTVAGGGGPSADSGAPAPAAAPAPAQRGGRSKAVTRKVSATKGRLVVRTRTARVSRRGVARVRVACVGDIDCSGTVRLRRGRRTLAKFKVNLEAGTARTMGVRLNRRGKRMLRSRRSLSVRTSVAGTSKRSAKARKRTMVLRASRSD